MLTAPSLSKIPGLKHGFFTRLNGHSSGLYDSLNCGLGSDDDRPSVMKNRAFCAKNLGVEPDHLLTVHQEHTANAVVADEPWNPEGSPVADALASNTGGLALAVLTADCVPILFAEPENRVIAASHAGWKGALTGVIENTIETMIKLGAARKSIVAAVGPCIGAKSYEVGPEFVERLVSADAANSQYFKGSNRAEHALFDIGAYVLDRTKYAGVASVERIEKDTCVRSEMFFSYRRSCHRGEQDYGRQLSGIAWAP